MQVLGIILAAGKGTRMGLTGPKVMQEILGKPLLWYVLKSLEEIADTEVYPLIGHQRAVIENYFPEYKDRFIVQESQLGTGHALQMAWPLIEQKKPDYILVTNGDTPLVEPEHFKLLLDRGKDFDLSFLSLTLENPKDYGRVLRNSNFEVERIVEAKDLSVQEKAIKEVNAGIYCFKFKFLQECLFELKAENAQKEYYITDLIGIAKKRGFKVEGVNLGNVSELLGINTVYELSSQEEFLRQKIVNYWQEQGVLIRQPWGVVIGPEVELEKGSVLSGPLHLLGKTRIYASARIGAYTFIKDSEIEGTIHEFCHVEGAEVKRGVNVGPYARLRPGAYLEEESRVGNFVEVKKSRLGRGSKANHLTYLGDSEIGPGVNIGAGTITCNYDGKNKHQTIIEEGAFIGSNTALVAPIKIGKRSLVGAGSTLTKEVPENTLAIARAKQVLLPRKKKD